MTERGKNPAAWVPPGSSERKEWVSPEDFDAAVQQIVLEGDRRMAENHGPEGIDPKHLHSPEHPQNLQRRAEALEGILGVTPAEVALRKMAVSWHDIVINYDTPADDKPASMIRGRHRGAREGDQPKGAEGNEAKSAAALAEEMRKKELFTEDQISRAVYAIDATYPDAQLGADFKGVSFREYPWYPEIASRNPNVEKIIANLEGKGISKGPLFTQPHLERALEAGQKVPPEALIIGLVDVGHPGCEDFSGFNSDGNGEFRELRPNILKNWERLATGNSDEDKADRAAVAELMMSWKKGQIGFAAWQMLRFEKIMLLLEHNGQITPDQVEQCRAAFSNFENNIQEQVKRTEEIEREYNRLAQEDERTAFIQLAITMGYTGKSTQ